MENKCESFTLPLGPKGLCFDRNHFLGSNFSVDVFLHNHRNAASLETMRDDLGIYLKVLRSAMIELINKDYADFVNLSANLIGLDKEINNIQSPLGQLKEEVLHVRECLSDAMKELSGRLEQRRLLREKKRSLQYLSQTQSSIQKLSNILFINDKPKDNITQELIERASSEYNLLRFTITKCEHFVTPEQKWQADYIGETLLQTLENMFLENLDIHRIDKLQRSLQIFSMLDRISDVETLLRKKIIAPAMHDIINESALQRNSSGLRGVFSNILAFIEQKLKDLIVITQTKKSSPIKGYNFLLNSLWPEVEYRLEVNMSSIFAPGNPELFYSRYNESLDFLKRIQKYFESRKAIEQFYNHPQYKKFQQKWNLPIYFQIRFQEIAGSLETTLSEPVNNMSFASNLNNSKDFSLKATQSCWKSLTSCWADGVFVLALTHRFWKLSLQILSRYSSWIDTTIKQPWTAINQSSQNNITIENTNTDKLNADRIKFLVSLHSDIRELLRCFPTFLEIVKTRINPTKHIGIFEKCLCDSQTLLFSKLPQIQKTVVLSLSSESVVHLKQINDIPRLFRKTNRDVPTKSCNYVTTLMKASLDFHNNYKADIGEKDIINWLEAIFSIITTQYYTATEDVLTSIQKTEDSLRRLKQIRDRPSQQNLEKAGLSDDDKIRLQLKVDVETYCRTLSDIKVYKDHVEKLNDLLNLVEKATNTKSNVLQ